MNIDFTLEERETVRAMCDIALKSNGILVVKEVLTILEKIKTQDADYTEADTKFLQQLCDITIRATGLANLQTVIVLLNKTQGKKD